MKKWLENIAFWTVYGTWYALSLLPMWMHYLFSDILYLIVAYVLRYRRRVIWKNLRNSYPEKTEQELKRLQRQFYRHMCDLVAETVKYTTISRKNIMRRMTFKGSEQVAEILSSGQSIALLLGHYGNWEWVTSLALWLPPVDRVLGLGQLYRQQAGWTHHHAGLYQRSGSQVGEHPPLGHLPQSGDSRFHGYRAHHTAAEAGCHLS